MKMTNARKVALGLSLAATTLAGGAYAQQAMKRDMTMTRAEVQAKTQERFARMDANHDGKLDRADRAARMTAMFDRMDTDKNGQISRAEFEAMHQGGHMGQMGRGDREHTGMHKMRGGGHHGHRGGGMGMMARMADTDKDGAISQAEFTSAALQHFDRMDTNKDGTVTREERQAARQAMREQWQARKAAAAPGN